MIDYIKYLKDNPKGYWFKRKLYGWGWIPARWQGWAFLAIWLYLFVDILILVDRTSHSVSDTLYGIFIPTILLIILLFLVCYATGEKPKWSWGR